jgi:cytoskeletal protein RodZ
MFNPLDPVSEKMQKLKVKALKEQWEPLLFAIIIVFGIILIGILVWLADRSGLNARQI